MKIKMESVILFLLGFVVTVLGILVMIIAIQENYEIRNS